MGKVILEIPDKINLQIKAKNIHEAIKKLHHLQPETNHEINSSIRKFKGIAKFQADINKEDWYLQ